MGNVLKIKNGNEWQSIPAIVGPQGPAGQNGATGATGPGVASGGTTGQVQKKKSNTDYDTEWANESGAVTDVQVNGSSVVNNGVADIPLVSNVTFGVGKATGTYGVQANAGELRIYPGSSADVKSASSNYRPIVPSTQHEAAFYGLAKAAGDSTQAASSNAVGTYTEDAKTAIKSMLGVTDIPSGGAANQVLKKNNGNTGLEWAGYSVPTGGYQGQVLTKTSYTNGAVGWSTINTLPSANSLNGNRTALCNKDGYWYEDEIIDTVFEYEFGQLVNNIQYYQDESGVDSSTFGLYQKFAYGDPTRLCFAGYDNDTGDIVYNYYNLDYVSEPAYDEYYTNDTAYDAYGFTYIGAQCHDLFVSRCNADGSITRKAFRAIYEDSDYNCWVLFDVTDRYDLSFCGGSDSSGSSLPVEGTAGQFLQKTADGEAWATVREVPAFTNDHGKFLYDNNGVSIWKYNTCELSQQENSGAYDFEISDIDDVKDAYIHGRRVIINVDDGYGNYDDNPYMMSGFRTINTNNVYTYLMQIERQKADGTFDRLQFLFSFNSTSLTWVGVEQTMPAASNAQSAVGVNF